MSNHGKFIWYELMTSDTKAAQAFYGKVVGWDTVDSGQTDKAYTFFQVAGTGVGGMLTTPPEAAGARPAWFGYVCVDDVDDAAARFETAGGKVHRPPADIPGVGRFAMVSDPQGAVIVLMTPTGEEAPDLGDQPGVARWRELMAADGAAAFQFYANMFDWTEVGTHDMGPMGLYRLFADTAGQGGGMMTKPDNGPAPHWNYYFRVDGAAAAAERIKSAGGTVANGPHQVPTGDWIVQAIDPQGAQFNVVSPNP
jgi:hypothetical protein